MNPLRIPGINQGPATANIDSPERSHREKQIIKGKITSEYRNYRRSVEISQRKPDDPITPRIDRECSIRDWRRERSEWRSNLHRFKNPPRDYSFDNSLEEELNGYQTRFLEFSSKACSNPLAEVFPLQRGAKIAKNFWQS